MPIDPHDLDNAIYDAATHGLSDPQPGPDWADQMDARINAYNDLRGRIYSSLEA